MIVKQFRGLNQVIDLLDWKKFKAGVVELKKGGEVGEHVTEDRREVIVVLDGRANVWMEGDEVEVSEGNLVYIPEDKKHNVFNKNKDLLRYIYIVTRV